MPDILIVVDTPGKEVFSSGGLLSKYAKANLKQKDWPFVIFTSLSDYQDGNKFYSKQQQLDEINQASKLLKFNWEVMYEGRKFKNNIHKEIGKDKFISDLKKRFEFVDPTTVINCSYYIEFGSDFISDSELIDQAIGDIIHTNKDNESKFTFSRLLGCHYLMRFDLPNGFYFELDPNDISNKRKAMLIYQSLYKKNVSIIDKTIGFHSEDAKLWDKEYVERYLHITGLIST